MNDTSTDQYIETQRQRYQSFAATGQTSSALDALWRGASAANALHRGEVSSEGFTAERVSQLLQTLGW
jgi:hypothetical protein